MNTCPNCGYCPHCGRKNLSPYSPYYPPYQPGWIYTPTVTTGGIPIQFQQAQTHYQGETQ